MEARVELVHERERLVQRDVQLRLRGPQRHRVRHMKTPLQKISRGFLSWLAVSLPPPISSKPFVAPDDNTG